MKELTQNSIQSQLDFWKNRGKRRIYLFGIETDFQKSKYPYVYYSILHVLDVLSLYKKTHKRPEFQEMLVIVNNKQATDRSFTAESIWRAFSKYDFGQKKLPLLLLHIKLHR